MDKCGTAGRILLAVVGVMLMLYAAVFSLLPLIGERTAGEVTVVRRELGESGGPIPNRYPYSIGYEFRLPDGRTVGGTTKRIGNAYSAGISKGPAGVGFLRGFPYFSALDTDAGPSLGKALMASVGGFLLAVSLRTGKRRAYP
jgi:hypothetical protein